MDFTITSRLLLTSLLFSQLKLPLLSLSHSLSLSLLSFAFIAEPLSSSFYSSLTLQKLVLYLCLLASRVLLAYELIEHQKALICTQ